MRPSHYNYYPHHPYPCCRGGIAALLSNDNNNDVVLLCMWQDSAHVEWDNYWDPKLMIANGIGDMKYTVSYSLHRDHTGSEGGGGGGGAIVCEHRHCQGQFFEFMELNKFPFDSQVRRSHTRTRTLTQGHGRPQKFF